MFPKEIMTETTIPSPLNSRLTILLAVACGLIAANLYYAQPLTGPIGQALGLSAGSSGLIVTMTQAGYGLGLLLIVPLGDRFENRRLMLCLLAICIFALVAAAMSTNAYAFLTASFLIGVGAVAVQVLVPYVAHLVPIATRGRVVGNVMGGLMFGIMMSRPIASVISQLLSWHAVFFISALVMAAVALILRLSLPQRQPAPGLRYGAMLTSMLHLAATNRILQRRSLYHVFLFGGFSLFWTTVPFLLKTTFHLSQNGIALFALAGVAGAVAAPIAGTIADRGWSEPATVFSMLAVAMAFLLSMFTDSGSPGELGLLTACAILLDFGVTANFVLGQRALFILGADVRSRLNGLYMAFFFAGGALGALIGGWAYARAGWTLAASIGLGMALAAIAYYCTGFLAKPSPPSSLSDKDTSPRG